MPRLLLADPRPLRRLGLRAALPDCPADEAETLADALRALPAADVALLGAPLAEPVTEAVCSRDAASRLLVVAPPDGPLATRLFRAGVAGYLPDTAAPAMLQEAVQAVAAGGTRWFVPLAPQPSFSPREAQALRLLARGHSNEEIADALGVRASTVRTHLANAYAKAGARTSREAIAWAWAHGLAHREPRQ
ncbi:MAG TPA: response regulator transcription factor [Bacteroidetes bacterium]|nr:response regulator transcription factor [Bacteroidota bacterium]